MSPQQWLERFGQEYRHWSAEMRADTLWPLVSDPEFVTHWLRDGLLAMARGSPALPPGYSDPALQSLVMLDDGHLHLSLAIIDAAAWNRRNAEPDAEAGVIEFADGWTRLRFLRAEGVTVQTFYRSDDGALRADEPQPARQGQEFALDNARQSLRLCALGGDVLLVRLLVRDPGLRHALECDAATGQVLRARQAQSNEARTHMALSLLRSLRRGEAVGIVRESIASWPAELRWHAVREMLLLDSHAGFALLETMGQSDPDKRLRHLACETRDQLIARYPQLGRVD